MNIKTSKEILKSLSDESRLQVLNALIDKPQCLEELTTRINLAPSTISFHLKKLETAGLVNKSKEQYYTIFQLNNDIFNLSLRELVSFDNIEKYKQEKRVEDFRKKVLKTFFKGKKLLKLPVQHKKKMIVIEHILESFEPNIEFNEKEVDSIINQSYEDHCLIRRLFIEEGFMTRDNGIYKRTIKV